MTARGFQFRHDACIRRSPGVEADTRSNVIQQIIWQRHDVRWAHMAHTSANRSRISHRDEQAVAHRLRNRGRGAVMTGVSLCFCY